MNKIFILLVVTSSLVACKKATTTTPTNTTNSITCVDNPNINFTNIGTSIGKFADCIKDIDENTYKTVTIGTQTWMAENLKVSKFNDGTTIPNLEDRVKWFNLNTSAWCYYNNDSNFNKKYGKLYNGYIVNQSFNGNKNICPTGWHVPSIQEWSILKDFTRTGLKGRNESLFETDTLSWLSPNLNSTNLSLFTALPGGRRNHPAILNGNLEYDKSPDFDVIKQAGFWWSSTNNEDKKNSRVYLLPNNNFYVGGSGDFMPLEMGYSIRCLKD